VLGVYQNAFRVDEDGAEAVDLRSRRGLPGGTSRAVAVEGSAMVAAVPC